MASASETIAIYNAVLQRDPTDAELSAFVAASTTPEDEAQQIDLLVSNSEARESVYPFLNLYQAIFGRAPDAAGLNFWVDALRGGLTLQTIVQGNAALNIDGFRNSAEFDSEYGSDVTPTDEAFVTALYQNLLGRAPDAAGLEFFTSLPPSATVGDVVVAFTGSPEFSAAITGQIRIFLTRAAEGIQDYLGSVYDVDDDGDVDDTDQDIVDALDDPVGGSFSFTGTVGEGLTGTEGNDTFSGVAATAGTFDVGDTADGGAGEDTFNLTVDTGGDLEAGAGTSNIEIVNIDQSATPLSSPIMATVFAGATQIWQIGGVQNINSVGDMTTLGFRNVEADLDIEFSGTTGTIVLDNVFDDSRMVLFGDTLETLSVSGSVDDDGGTPPNPGEIEFDPGTGLDMLATVNFALTSDTYVDVYGLLAVDSFSVFDASASTGGIETEDFENFNYLTTILTGSGNDDVHYDTDYTADGNGGLAVQIGVGNGDDIVELQLFSATDNTSVDVTIGDGADSVLVTDRFNHINDASEGEFENGIVTVTDFEPSEDTLDFSDFAFTLTTLSNAQLNDIGDETSLFDAVSLAATFAVDVTTDIIAFNFGGNAYVYYDQDDNEAFSTGDGLMELSGVSVSELNGTNFVV